MTKDLYQIFQISLNWNIAYITVIEILPRILTWQCVLTSTLFCSSYYNLSSVTIFVCAPSCATSRSFMDLMSYYNLLSVWLAAGGNWPIAGGVGVTSQLTFMSLCWWESRLKPHWQGASQIDINKSYTDCLLHKSASFLCSPSRFKIGNLPIRGYTEIEGSRLSGHTLNLCVFLGMSGKFEDKWLLPYSKSQKLYDTPLVLML